MKKIKLSDSLAILIITFAIHGIWVLLEQVFYGEIQPRIVDDFIGLLLIASIFVNYKFAISSGSFLGSSPDEYKQVQTQKGVDQRKGVLNMKDFETMLKMGLMDAMMSGMKGESSANKKDDHPGLKSYATPQEVQTAGAKYLEKNVFQLGQLVQWKPGMRDCKVGYGVPVAVVEIAPQQKSDLGMGESNHSGKPCDLRIGLLDSDGDFSTFWVDSNRFEPYKG